MTTKKLNFTQQVTAPLSYVYYLFNNKSGWSEWFAVKAYGYVKQSLVMHAYHETEGDFLLHFTAVKPEEQIQFDLTEMKTKQTSQVEVTFSEEGGMVTVALKHSGLPAERTDFYENLWGKGLENLKSMAEEGIDLRTWERPFLGVTVESWIDSEMAEEKSLAVDYGMLLSSVIEGRGAETAGLQQGDIIVQMDGVELHDFSQFLEVMTGKKAGDEVDLGFFREDEKQEVTLTLSSYPAAEAPATAHDYAEKIDKFYRTVRKTLKSLIEEYSEAQFEIRPGPGEWSAKETIAHLISSETDIQVWISTVVAGCEEYACSSSHAVRIKGLTAQYATAGQLLEVLSQRQNETVSLIAELPAEFVSRKGSIARLANHLNLDLSRHYKENLPKIKESLGQAENVRAR